MSQPSAAFLAHIVSQIQQSVDLLAAESHISQSDAAVIKSKLPDISSQATQGLPVVMPVPGPVRRNISVPSSSPVPQIIQARAIWGYNENGQDSNDLAFAAGDIIEIVAETNEDWWMGKHNGRQALFPANYVEKIDVTTAASRNFPPAYTKASAPVSEKKSYKPFMAAHTDAPPSDSGTNSIGLQQDSDNQQKKKNKFGKYGNTMAHSAAGGVGFGAGAAIGGGLVRAIF